MKYMFTGLLSLVCVQVGAIGTDPQYLRVETIAGNGERGFADGAVEMARFDCPMGVTVDDRDNIFVADTENHRIRCIGLDGQVRTVAGGERGFADGPVHTAQFNHPVAVAVDRDGTIIVADYMNKRIRRINLETGMVTTVAGSGYSDHTDGLVGVAQFIGPRKVAVDRRNGAIYVIDDCCRIRLINQETGMVSTIAGLHRRGFADGLPEVALFQNPSGIAVRDDGSVIVGDKSRIRRIDGETREVSTIAGPDHPIDGAANEAVLGYVSGIALDRDGTIIVLDASSRHIRSIDGAGTVRVITSDDGDRFIVGDIRRPFLVLDGGALGISTDRNGNLIVLDSSRVLKITTNDGWEEEGHLKGV